MTDISKRIIKEGRGLSSRSENPRSLKDFLVYLVYINMLGHDTSWAVATVIQLCGNKNLQVKRTAYLAASLLIDPMSELTILLTATIQADLRSDNYLTVCTALQAIPTIANAELAGVFLPEVIGLVRHEKDAVKKRALTTLHSLLLVEGLDQSLAGDIGKVLIDKLAYKEPAVMFAVLPGLYDLIDRDPEPYKGLVHYFTNILKQASDGKLGRNWVVHRAPAPFLQVTLLRLLGRLGQGDAKVSKDIQSVLVDVWKRAESLTSQAGNAILFECMKVATSIVPSDALYSMALESAAMFLNSADNNLKCAGIEVLTRMIEDGDAGKVAEYQYAIVTALRSSDVTLKGRTLDLLFRMAGPNNVDVVFTEVLQFVMDDAIDDESRRYASSRLLEMAERFAPSCSWFLDSVTEMLKKAGAVAPAAAQSSLVRVLGEADRGLQERMTVAYYELIESNAMVSVPLAKVICWTLGEYGIESGISFDTLATTLGDVLESRRMHAPELAVVCIMSLSKINVRSSRPLPIETTRLLESLQRSAGVPLSVQQAAFELCSIAQLDLASKGVNMSVPGPQVDAGDGGLAFLDDIASAAIAGGAAPYLGREEREAIGMQRVSATQAQAAQTSHLRFEAYQREVPSRVPSGVSAVDDVWAGVAGTTLEPTAAVAPVDELFGGLQMNDSAMRETATSRESGQPEGIHVSRQRRWGPSTGGAASRTQQPASTSGAAPAAASMSAATSAPRVVATPARAVDPLQERLAASLFGGAGAGSTSSGGAGRGVRPPAPASAFDLLDMLGDSGHTTAVHSEATQRPQQDDLLDLLGDVPAADGPAAPAAPATGDPFSLL